MYTWDADTQIQTCHYGQHVSKDICPKMGTLTQNTLLQRTNDVVHNNLGLSTGQVQESVGFPQDQKESICNQARDCVQEPGKFAQEICKNFVRVNRACELSEQMINHILPYLHSCAQDDCVNNLRCANNGGSNYPGSTVYP